LYSLATGPSPSLNESNGAGGIPRCAPRFESSVPKACSIREGTTPGKIIRVSGRRSSSIGDGLARGSRAISIATARDDADERGILE
jgi:hypothetical protein